MSETSNYRPLQERVITFGNELHALFRQAVDERLVELQESTLKDVSERIYGPHSALARFEKFQVNASNAKKAANLFELMEELKDMPGEDVEAIVKKGSARGFERDEALVVYNMCRYQRAFANMKAQKEETIKLLLAEATKV